MYADRLRKCDWEIRCVSREAAWAVVAEHHYAAGGSNTATFAHGLFRKDDPFRCRGVAWWIPPTRAAAQAAINQKTELCPDGIVGVTWQQVLSLSRMAFDPGVPKNAPTFTLARSERLIAQDGRFPLLVTYADVWRGHTGDIYRLAGWEYLGLSEPEEVWVDRHGRMVARKAGPKTRTRREMLELGHQPQGKFPKHRFRKLLPAVRPRRVRTLFGVEVDRGKA